MSGTPMGNGSSWLPVEHVLPDGEVRYVDQQGSHAIDTAWPQWVDSDHLMLRRIILVALPGSLDSMSQRVRQDPANTCLAGSARKWFFWSGL